MESIHLAGIMPFCRTVTQNVITFRFGIPFEGMRQLLNCQTVKYIKTCKKEPLG
jgi:hypothetical protein